MLCRYPLSSEPRESVPTFGEVVSQVSLHSFVKPVAPGASLPRVDQFIISVQRIDSSLLAKINWLRLAALTSSAEHGSGVVLFAPEDEILVPKQAVRFYHELC